MKLKAIIAAGALFFGGVAIYTANTGPVETVQDLIKQEEALNDRCRGGSGDEASTWEACSQRDALSGALQKQGWCYGTPKQAEYQKEWARCSADPTVAEAPSLQRVNDDVQFDQKAALKKERLDLLYLDTDGCLGRMARLQLRIGERSRKLIIEKMVGVCGMKYAGERLAFGYTQPKADMDAYLLGAANQQLDSVLQTQP